MSAVLYAPRWRRNEPDMVVVGAGGFVRASACAPLGACAALKKGGHAGPRRTERPSEPGFLRTIRLRYPQARRGGGNVNSRNHEGLVARIRTTDYFDGGDGDAKDLRKKIYKGTVCSSIHGRCSELHHQGVAAQSRKRGAPRSRYDADAKGNSFRMILQNHVLLVSILSRRLGNLHFTGRQTDSRIRLRAVPDRSVKNAACTRSCSQELARILVSQTQIRISRATG